MDQRPKLRPKTITLLEENMEQKLHIRFCQSLLRFVIKDTDNKRKRQTGLRDILKFCASKTPSTE